MYTYESENAKATHSSTLAWKIPWTEEPGRLQPMGSLGLDWVTSLSLFTFHFHALEKEMATHSSVLAWRIPGTGELGGLLSVGSHRVGHDWSNLAAAAAAYLRMEFLGPMLTLCLTFWGIAKPISTATALFYSPLPAKMRFVCLYFFFFNVLKLQNLKTETLGSDQIRSVAQLCPTLCDPMNRSTPGLPVHHHLLEFTQTHVHWVSDAIQPSHPLLSPSPPAPNPSQHQSLFQWVNSSHEVAKVLEFQL